MFYTVTSSTRLLLSFYLTCMVWCENNVLFNRFWRKFLQQVFTEMFVELIYLHFNTLLWYFSYCFFGVILNFALLECTYGLTHGYEFIILLILWGTWSYVRKRWWWKHQCKALKILFLRDILPQKNLKAGIFIKALECFIISWHTYTLHIVITLAAGVSHNKYLL